MMGTNRFIVGTIKDNYNNAPKVHIVWGRGGAVVSNKDNVLLSHFFLHGFSVSVTDYTEVLT